MPVLAAGDPGERALLMLVGEDEVPSEDSPTVRPAAVPVLPASLLVVVPSIAVVDAAPIPLSISLKARSTFGRLKLLLPKGPTIPAETSAGFRNAPRGSLSGFFEFSS